MAVADCHLGLLDLHPVRRLHDVLVHGNPMLLYARTAEIRTRVKVRG
ncbi:hypothetical protein H4W81_000406 [Nonomuraea africana]|uniref:Uncharacterized protein n=1 Tax=Nonomuraea africana TaxID=46171 RepID=A0ABR9K6J4_9ACTN|nr:hypothetical protein [Nonomuraea africana]